MSVPMDWKPERAVQAKIRGHEKESIFSMDWKPERAIQAKVRTKKRAMIMRVWSVPKVNVIGSEMATPINFHFIICTLTAIKSRNAILSAFHWVKLWFWSVLSTLKSGIMFGSWRIPWKGISLETCGVIMIRRQATFFFDLPNLVPTLYRSLLPYKSHIFMLSFIHASVVCF